MQRLIPAIPSINQLQFQALNSQLSAPVWQQQGADVWRVSHYQVLISRPPSDSHKKDNQAVASSRNHTMMMHCSTSLFSSLLDQFKYPNKRVCWNQGHWQWDEQFVSFYDRFAANEQMWADFKEKTMKCYVVRNVGESHSRNFFKLPLLFLINESIN